MKGRRARPHLLVLMALAVLMAALLVASACAGASTEGNSGDEFPAYAYNSSMTLAGYKAAVKVRNDLYAIPCFCGCGPSQGHTSMLDCFFNADGSYSDHASNCHVCAEQAVDVAQWREEGVPLKEVRARIEAKYSQSGPGTNTPPLP